MESRLKVGLVGYGKAGQAVARVLSGDARLDLRWALRRQAATGATIEGRTDIPVQSMEGLLLADWLDAHPVDAIVDFSAPDAVQWYAEEVRGRRLLLVTAISSYTRSQLALLESLGADARVLYSPNITLGINFLMMAARLLRGVAPYADVEVVEQHFREKPEVSGTARKIARSLDLDDDSITSLRVGGIVGHHEVIFGFPHQTVRLIHDSIRREAFGTGAAHALQELLRCPKGFYTFEDLLQASIRRQLLAAT